MALHRSKYRDAPRGIFSAGEKRKKYRRQPLEYDPLVNNGEPTLQQHFKFSLRRKAIREDNEEQLRRHQTDGGPLPSYMQYRMANDYEFGGGERSPCKTGRLDGRCVRRHIEDDDPSWSNSVRHYEDLDHYRNFGF